MAEGRLSLCPLSRLGSEARSCLAQLNAPKVIPNEDGLPRDARGLAHLALDPAPPEVADALSTSTNPASTLLHFWQKCPVDIANMQLLCDFLERLDRHDVLADIKPLLEADAEKFASRAPMPAPVMDVEHQLLTSQDVQLLSNGADELQMYDAFILHADEDEPFVMEIIRNMEEKGFKFCLKDDLLGGLTFQHTVVRELIAKRCYTLMIILSPKFIASKFNAHFINYAQAIGIAEGQRKLLPIIYEPCECPEPLKFYFALDYIRNRAIFWEKLARSLQGLRPTTKSLKSSQPQIKELSSDRQERITSRNREAASSTINGVNATTLPATAPPEKTLNGNTHIPEDILKLDPNLTPTSPDAVKKKSKKKWLIKKAQKLLPKKKMVAS